MPEPSSEQTAPVLTDKQRRFVEEYLVDFNAAAAARRAGYSEDVAKQQGYENLTKPYLYGLVSARMAEMTMSAEEAALKLTNWGRGTIEPFMTQEGFLDLNNDDARANLYLIKKVKMVKRIELAAKNSPLPDYEIVSTEIELHDAKDATVKVLEYHGKMILRHEHTGPNKGPIEVDFTRMSEDELRRFITDAEPAHPASAGGTGTD